MIVLDASAAADVVLERGDEGDWVARAIVSAESLHAPHLIDIEVASAVRRLALAAELPPARARRGLELFQELELTRYPMTPLLERVWLLRHRMTAYDAVYVALAEELGLPLVTTDARLAGSRGHHAEIVAYAG